VPNRPKQFRLKKSKPKPSGPRLYDLQAWRGEKGLAKTFLRAHPLCVECEKQGALTPATEVDHIIPHKGDEELFWNYENLRGLCKRHHSEKTVREDGGGFQRS
jgi:5-methylcytosine-specific restriction protein A